MKLIECPRDAIQGISSFVPTEAKAKYINQLLKVGFDAIDFGSFVSPKAIPQMRDTAEVLDQLDLGATKSRLLAIVANMRGAEEALNHEQIDDLGFPFSISETFQQRNTNKSIAEALHTLEEIQERCLARERRLVCYISMGFGNPYNDQFSPEVVSEYTDRLVSMGIGTISLADTVGAATPALIELIFKALIPAYPAIEFGGHFHSTPATAHEKIAAAYNSGCERFDGAIRGFGGCPMAKDELVGNIATEQILSYFETKNLDMGINTNEFEKAISASTSIFG